MTVLLALVGSLVFGASDFIGGVASRQAPPLRVAALAQLTAFGFAVPVALALAMPWGRRLPRRLMGLFAWGGTGLLALRSAASVIQTVYLIGSGHFVFEGRGLWELWFYLGATLFFLATWHFWRHRVPMSDAA